ncbi:MAG: ATP synthase subunit I [Hylemonella sp.]
MKEVLLWSWPLVAGLGLGLLYFLGLWLTVRGLPGRAAAPLWWLVSLALRLALLLSGLYWVGAQDWRRLLLALAGILLARWVLTRRLGRLPTPRPAAPAPSALGEHQ